MTPTKTKGFGKTPTLGVMIDWMEIPYQRQIVAGVWEAARNAGATLLCFAGGHLYDEAQRDARNRVFEFIHKPQVDGLVAVTATMMKYVGQRGIESYFQRHFRGLPLFSIGVILEEFPSIVVNNQAGVKELIRHLVRVHGHKHIAFVRGPINNSEAEERFEAYVETLKELGIPFDTRLVVVGDFTTASGGDAVSLLAQHPDLRLEDLDAIVAANDAMAVGVIESLTKRGIVVPDTIAVTGFDDIEDAQVIDTPLTTVRQPLEKIGRLAASNVLAWIQFNVAPGSAQVDTELVVRRSCGCTQESRSDKQSVAPSIEQSFESALIMRRQQILGSLARAARGELGVAGSGWEAKVLMALVSELRGESRHAFAHVIGDMGEKIVKRGHNVQSCFEVITTLKNQMFPLLRRDIEYVERADVAFYEAYDALATIVRRSIARERIRLSRWVFEVSHVCNELSGVLDASALQTTIYTQMTRLGFRNYYVVLDSEQASSSRLELLVACEDGHELTQDSINRFYQDGLLPVEAMERVREGRAFAVMPLAWKTDYLGFVLFEIDSENTNAFAAIAEAMSIGISALRR